MKTTQYEITMNLEQLSKYCDINPNREYLWAPFNFNGRSIATNGEILISAPEIVGLDDIPEKIKDRVDGLLSIEGDFEPVSPDVEIPASDPCKTCNSSGKVSWAECEECGGEGDALAENDYNEYHVNCKSCDGEGGKKIAGDDIRCERCHGTGNYYPPGAYVTICGITVAPHYAKQVLAFPDLKGFGNDGALHFKSGDIRGMLMGLRV